MQGLLMSLQHGAWCQYTFQQTLLPSHNVFEQDLWLPLSQRIYYCAVLYHTPEK